MRGSVLRRPNKRILENYANATIRKYVTLYLLEKKAKREQLEFHRIYHLPEITFIQEQWRKQKTRLPKLDVPRFKQLFYAYLQGWKIRRIMSYLKSLPEVKEAIDFVKLKADVEQHDNNDAFSRQIMMQYPEKLEMFQDRFQDLLENAIWIKKPVPKLVNKAKKPYIKSNSKNETVSKKKTQHKEPQKQPKVPPHEKSKTFKQQNTQKTRVKANQQNIKAARKHPAERQPKQRQPNHVPQIQKVSQHKELSEKNDAELIVTSEVPKMGHSKQAPSGDRVSVRLDQLSKIPFPKASRHKHASSTTRQEMRNGLVGVPKGTSFGLLAQKNHLELNLLNSSQNFERSPVQTKDKQRKDNISNTLSILNFHNVRKSHDPHPISSFKEPASTKHRDEPTCFSREGIMTKKRAENDSIKLIPLNERRSQTRRMRATTLTRNDDDTPIKVKLTHVRAEQEERPQIHNLVKINVVEKSFEVDESEQLSTYALYSKLISGTLERLGGSDALQLACLEQ